MLAHDVFTDGLLGHPGDEQNIDPSGSSGYRPTPCSGRACTDQPPAAPCVSAHIAGRRAKDIMIAAWITDYGTAARDPYRVDPLRFPNPRGKQGAIIPLQERVDDGPPRSRPHPRAQKVRYHLPWHCPPIVRGRSPCREFFDQIKLALVVNDVSQMCLREPSAWSPVRSQPV